MNLDTIYSKLKSAIIDGLLYVKNHEEEFFRFTLTNYHDDYYTINYRDTGYPSFYKSSYSKRKYSGLFYKDDCKNMSSWKEFQEYILLNDDFCKFFEIGKYFIGNHEIRKKNLNDLYSSSPITEIIERYIHIYSTKEFDEEKFKLLFNEWANHIFSKELKFDIIVPILMVTFDFEKLDILENLSIERMNDILQRSRNIKKSENSSPHEMVMSASTHALVIKGQLLLNDADSRGELYNINFYNSTINTYIDKVFAFLRIKSGLDTGYCQIIAKPDNWASFWDVDLIPLKIVSIKAYPDYFENYYWRNPPKKITESLFINGDLNNYLNPIQRNVEVAINRLNNSFLRKHIDDSILDITMALEALFIEGSENSEVTHKLAIRVAVLCKLFPINSLTSFQIFKICKKIYSFRSAIIHSKEKKDLDKNRIIKAEAFPEISSVEAGIKILSHSINILLKNPEYLKPENIDSKIFE
ncbi:hypothetical protein [Emticicia fontis]